VSSVILESLKIGKPECKLRKGCILEGELAVYSDLVSLGYALLWYTVREDYTDLEVGAQDFTLSQNQKTRLPARKVFECRAGLAVRILFHIGRRGG
jgi:hypothetical protein